MFSTLFLPPLYVSFGLFSFSFLSRLEFLFLSMKFLFHWDVGFPIFIFVYLKVNRFWFQKNDGQIVWILIQTHIRNTDSYSNTDSENLHISLTNQWFSRNVIKVSQRVANDQIIDEKASLQKSVILPIIQGVSPTSPQAQ